MRRTNPFEEIEELLDQMSREFAFDSELNLQSPTVPVDVIDDGSAFVVHADLPGYEKADIEVTLSGRTLRIDGERETSATAEDADVVRQERHQEAVNRSVRLPEAVEADGIEATFSDGVLTVTLPKAEPDEGKRIEIE
ncbi:MAG: Hsp20/alpha crystallin family protein [Halobacteriales archaeon]|nr:Hsp20/alpha crystallin family protein [Halobacteriales archaeon]